MAKRDVRIKELKRQSKDKEEKKETSLENIQRSVSTDLSRDALRKAGFLRERYEHHLGLNKPKEVARHDANQDLMENYGPDSEFTDQELEDVLS
ncbi:hypothetical protein [Solemya velesiana gill symbiont]|uniref:Uncharacterized protein n=1 Tax=Solemya velesiana gill symbiont TaxID=1918948 RepID=A0A1T2KU00_9GAMM|nr:hypothetical protein [Solemya velesiana gill symbiont]OOZ36302.1 hypothetical protein BOW51_07750 [Solemya velesiana gill symbiont]